MLLSLGCFRIIRHDAGSLHIACGSAIAALLKETGTVDAFSSSDNSLFASLYSGNADGGAAEFLSRFDRAYIFTVRTESPFVESVRTIIPRARTVLTIPPAAILIHTAEFRMQQLAHGKSSAAVPQPLDIPIVHKQRARDILARAGYREGERPLVVLHPGSGGKGKRRPLDNYFKLADALAEKHEPFFLFLSGPAEDRGMREAVENFTRCRADSLHIADEELIAVAALLNSCSLYVGNDSGVTHLAAASGAPQVIALFGPTNPLLWKPVGRGVHVVVADEELYAKASECLTPWRNSSS